MTTEAQIEAAARSDAAFDGRGWEAMARTDRDRYLARSRAALEAAERAAWQDTLTAPKGGQMLLLLARFRQPPDRREPCRGDEWTEVRIAQWPWHGLAGQIIAWRPLPAPPEGTPA